MINLKIPEYIYCWTDRGFQNISPVSHPQIIYLKNFPASIEMAVIRTFARKMPRPTAKISPTPGTQKRKTNIAPLL